MSSALWYAGRIRYTARMFDALATTVRQLISACTQACRKVLVVDLDNTLWGGIVGEVGPDGVALGEDGSGRCYRDFQRSLKALQRTGVLLAVASKNDQADVEEIVAENPAMILRREDFAAIGVNWADKAANILKIAETLNLGITACLRRRQPLRRRRSSRSCCRVVHTIQLPQDPVDNP